MFATGTERCLVKLYKIYRSRRPVTSLNPTDPLFLQVDKANWMLGKTWFKKISVGENRLGSILTEARKKFGMVGKKVSNHTVRKTGISRLLDGGIPETFVAQHEGMKSIDSLKSYKAPGEQHMVQMSHILDRYTSSTSTITHPTPTSLPITVAASTDPVIPAFSNKSMGIQQARANTTWASTSIPMGSFNNNTNCTFHINMGGDRSEQKIYRKR